MLLEHIKKDRRKQRSKPPLPETVFAVVAGIVQKFDLKTVPDGTTGVMEPWETNPGGRLSLFPLLSAAQWRLTAELIEKYDNPYLGYARSPEDFERSHRLYEINPKLTADTLKHFSLGWLWEQEATRGPREPGKHTN